MENKALVVADTGIKGHDEIGWSTFEELLMGYGAHMTAWKDAIKVTAFMSCNDVIAQDITKATFRMYERLDNGGKKIVAPNEHALAEFFYGQPSKWHSWDEFFEILIRHLCFSQNAYIVKRVTRRGDLREMLPVLPDRTSSWILPETRELWYDIRRQTMYEDALLRGIPYRVPADQVIHLRTRIFDGFNGLSSLVTGSDALGLAKKISEYQERLYGNDGRHKGVFEVPGDFSDAAFQRLRRQLTELWKKHKSSEDVPIILEGGANFKNVTMTASDADIAKVREAQVNEVARLCRVPPHKIMLLSAVKYENIDVLERQYAADTLIPIARRIEKKIEVALLEPAERHKYFFEFDRSEMIIQDPKTRTDAAVRGVQSGILRIDEGRRMMEQDPLPGDHGKNRMIPVNMSVINEAGEIVVQGAAPAKDPGKDGSATDENDPKSSSQDANRSTGGASDDKILQFQQRA